MNLFSGVFSFSFLLLGTKPQGVFLLCPGDSTLTQSHEEEQPIRSQLSVPPRATSRLTSDALPVCGSAATRFFSSGMNGFYQVRKSELISKPEQTKKKSIRNQFNHDTP